MQTIRAFDGLELFANEATAAASSSHLQRPQQRERMARLLKLFCSARKRSGLTPDEVLILLTIGYLSISASKNVVLVQPVSFTDVARALGIPKETVRRKMMRLADVDYVSISRSGIAIKKYETWCRMFERAVD